ncbi:MAG: M48 family metalloprotease [Telluria sp.]
MSARAGGAAIFCALQLLAFPPALGQEASAPVPPPAAEEGNFFTRLFKQGPDKPVLDKLRGQPFQPSNQAIGAERDLMNERAAGYGLVAHDELQAYANGVLDKLKAASGISGLPGTVHLLATDQMKAHATADGNIYISYRWFENLNRTNFKRGQEDTLAALLAHELGHVALGHHNSDFFANAGKWIQRYYTQLSLLKVLVDQKFKNSATLSDGAMKNLKKMQLLVEVTDGMVHPAWKRGQEEDADAFAVDVTRAAGYSYQEGVKRFLELNNSAEQVQAARDEARLAAMNAAVETSFKEGKLDEALNGIGTQALTRLGEMLKSTHPDPAARTDKLSAYVAKFHPAEWHEDAEAPVSDAYRKAAATQRSKDLFDMYNTAFEFESLVATMKPEDLRAAVAKGTQITRKIGLKNVNHNNWLLFYQYARALDYASDLEPLPAALPAPPKAARKGKRAAAAEPVARVLNADELQAILVASEAAMSFKPYEDSINRALKSGNRELSLQLLAKTDKKFELARSVLPRTIALYSRAGNAERARELVGYCATTYIDARDDCAKSADVK